MADSFRDTALGYLIRLASGNKVLQFPEDRSDFQLPDTYRNPVAASTDEKHESAEQASSKDETPMPNIDEVVDIEDSRAQSIASMDSIALEKSKTNRSANSYLPAVERIHSLRDIERAITMTSMRKEPTRPIVPVVTESGDILVDWYTTDDPANPQNWTLRRKGFIAFQICIYTTAVYMGSAIYTPSEGGVMQAFGVNATDASLGLALYVLGYGTGPLLFSPLSEIPIIGRNPPYILTFGIFVILCVPTALVNNFAGFLVLRFLQGFFGSPCLATGGATFQDIYNIMQIPFLMTAWVASATCGPSLGPVIAGFSVPAENWRWSLWEILWLAGPIFILLFLCLPETSSSNILLRRAQRIRKLTGNPAYKSQSEIDQSQLTTSAILSNALWKPAQIHVLDPAVAFATIYAALTYGIYYSFFEAFPLVYMDKYNFNLGQMGLTFLSITVSVAVAIILYCSYLAFFVNPRILKFGLGAPEQVLIPALGVSGLIPIGLFLFGWTANGHTPWIVSVIGVGIYNFSVFIVFQCIFLYIPFVYPQYAASLFAGNDFARSAFSVGSILFARPLFMNLGIGRGISLLAGLTVGCFFGVWALWYYGASLRAKSRFTVKA
ncbi:hypothetical protein MMC25_003310 [Agyrium rufum]|nr:hypothetical protein [Agyrium rufum]